MTGKLKAAVYLVFALSISFAVLVISSHESNATWEATYSAILSNTAPYANPDTTVGYGVAIGHSNFARVDNTAAPSSFLLATDSDIPDGERVGQIFSSTKLGLLNADCIAPIGVLIPFMDATTDVTDTVDFVGTGDTHAAALGMLARRGLYSIVGFGGVVVHPSVAFVSGETAITGNLVGNWIDLWELLQLHGRGAVTLRTETYPLEDVNEVLNKLREGEVTGRAVLIP